jgi:hypothetical protein
VITIRVALFEERGVWVVQGMEVDIRGEGLNEVHAIAVFSEKLILQALEDRKAGRRVFQNLRPAPPVIWERFEWEACAKVKIDLTPPIQATFEWA